jgi:hypothetical protein
VGEFRGAQGGHQAVRGPLGEVGWLPGVRRGLEDEFGRGPEGLGAVAQVREGVVPVGLTGVAWLAYFWRVVIALV